MNRESADLFASTSAPSRLELVVAALAGLIILLVLATAAAFARTPLPEAPAVVGAYAAWFGLAETVIGILLFALFLNQRSPGLFVLAVGSILMPMALVAYLTTHAVPMTSATAGSGLAALWGAGYPAFVLVYAALGGATGREPGSGWNLLRLSPAAQVVVLAGGTVVACGALNAMIQPASRWLLTPAVAGRWPPAYHVICFALSAPAAGAAAILALRRSRSVLDLWLAIDMTALAADLILNGLSGAQYDLGWYAGRGFGLVASSTLLLALLIESAAHYGRLAELNEALIVSNRALEHLSLHDGLTGLPNRRYFDTHLNGQVLLTRRRARQRDLALVLIDVDSFKAYNDIYGHPAGDECLTHVAIALKTCCLRPGDMAARYGGEEFALILPDTDLASALRIAEAAREAVLKLELSHSGSVTGPVVSISGGVATLGEREETTVEALVAAADKGLFIAKMSGRNQMVSAPPDAIPRRA
jgi:diguanylate cyclase (GGDEF)-like protein